MNSTSEQEYGAFYEESTNTLERAMYNPANAYPQGHMRQGGNTIRTLFVSVVGLLPVGIVSGMMLMQILGVWAY